MLELVQLRSTVSDFAVLIAILCCTSLDYFMELDTPKLQVPATIKVSTHRDQSYRCPTPSKAQKCNFNLDEYLRCRSV